MKKNFMKITTIACLIVVALFVAGLPNADEPEELTKNVILLIGDGMGPYHVELTRLCLEVSELAMEELDEGISSYVTTYALDRDDRTTHVITDSAAAGTALATGYKTRKRAISVDFDGNTLETVLERAEAEGKATGLITDVYLEDATPAAFAAHVEHRGMYEEIAVQLAYSDVEVLMGAGRGFFLPKGEHGGQRMDGRNLIDEMENMGYIYVDSAKELENADINLGDGDKLLGFFGGLYNMAYDLDRQQDKEIGVPTLAEMTEKTIEVLSQDPDGFFLMVEGGSLDWVAHNRDVAGVVRETEAFDEAVQIAWDFATGDGAGETLVVVTADHECGGLQMTSDSVGNEPPTFVPISEDLNVDFVMNITATTDYMWGEIGQGEYIGDIEDTVLTYTGYDLSDDELDLIIEADNAGEMIIADLLSAEAGVVWGFTGTDEGEHTFAAVPVYAYGPNAEKFDLVTDNTELSMELFIAVSGYWH
ncbi:MAG: alkaline phosphatase [Candidatus Bathyarchaeota archaeon]|nr:alkaline phosphatase [Candidatus Bathyarchaeota archaeon]MDH5713522.1 alkaline phosphatase [Candidatus Bathyarchaeota archaeon]